MRLPLATPLISRDGTLVKDPLVTNGIIEGDKKSSVVRSRPGLVDLGLIEAGLGQLLVCWNGLLSVVNDSLSSLLYSSGVDAVSADEINVVTSRNWYQALYGSNTLLLLSTATCNRSLDEGVTWTSFTAPDSSPTEGVFAFGKFIVWASDGDSAAFDYSSDSVTWSTGTAAASFGGNPAISATAVVVPCFGSTNTALRSTNGTTFTTVTLPSTATWTGFGYDGTVFCGIISGTATVTVSSDDGVNWTNHSTLPASRDWVGVAGHSGRLVAVASGTNLGALSTDGGATWVEITLPVYFSTAGAYNISSDGAFFYATRAGSTQPIVAYSSDGVTWSSILFPNTAGATNPTDVAVVGNARVFAYNQFSALVGSVLAGDLLIVTPIAGFTPATLGATFSAEATGAAQSQQELLFKSSEQLWQYTEAGGLVLVTDIDYPGHHTYTASSVTRSGSTATFNTTVTNALEAGQTVTIAGANQTEYNGSHEILSIVDGDTFTYAVTGTPVTPATGTITVYGGKTTVPGLVFLDGYFFVMTDKGVIFNSALGDGTSWNALDFVTAAEEPGDGVALGKIGNYLVAFKEWSTEPFYDAGNATGSPISPVRSTSTLIGCASGESLASFDGKLVWVSQTKDKGRSVHAMTGLQQLAQIATPDVERVLAADDLASVSAYGIRIAGHVLYILTLHTSAVTLVYDFTTGVWTRWTSLTADTPLSVTSMVRNGTTVTVVTSTAHGRSDGDPVLFAGADQSDYNGRFNVQVISSTSLSFEVSSSQDTTATGTITATTYTEGHFALTKHVYCTGRHLLLHESNGHLYEILDSETSDALAPIDLRCRTGKVDGNRASQKQLSQLEVIGHKTTNGLALVRWTDDDYASWSAYRQVDLGAERSRLRRCGNFSRRAFELRYTGDAKVTLGALELGEKG